MRRPPMGRGTMGHDGGSLRTCSVRSPVRMGPGRCAVVLGMLLLAGCAGDASAPSTTISSDAAASGAIRGYKVGKPYQVKGVWYYPQVDYSYSEDGIASWYGPGFHGKATANGEVYDMNDMTAAHKTLPLPTIVRVTNLENGRSIKVRVNDRGPFVGDRIIDLSRRSAQMLGFYGAGTAHVRVEVVEDESRQLLADLADASGTTIAAATPAVPVLASAPASVPVVAAEPVTGAPDVSAYSTPDEFGQPASGQTAIGAPIIGQAPLIEATATPDVPVEPEPWAPPVTTTPLMAAPVEVAEIPPLPTGAAPVVLGDSSDAGSRAVISAAWEPPTSTPLYVPHRTGPSTDPVPQAVGDRRVAWVQAGAFADADRVDRATHRLRSIGPVVTSSSRQGGRELVRVRVGPFHSEAEAERMLASVSRAGFPDCRLVVE